MPLVVKYAEVKSVPEGAYVAKLINLETQTHPQWGEGIRWTFEIQDHPEHAGVNVTAMSSTKVSPKSKIFSWAQAFGISLMPGQEVDLENLIGKTVRIRVKNKTQQKNVDGREVSLTFSNVDALAPYVPPVGTASPPTSPQPVVASAPVVTPQPAPAAAPSNEGFATENDDFDF